MGKMRWKYKTEENLERAKKIWRRSLWKLLWTFKGNLNGIYEKLRETGRWGGGDGVVEENLEKARQKI